MVDDDSDGLPEGFFKPNLHVAGLLTQFKKGTNFHSDPEKVAGSKFIRKLSKVEIVEAGAILILGTRYDLHMIEKDPLSSNLEVMIAAICRRVHTKADMHAFNLLLDRVVGKVKEEVALTSNIPQVVVTLPSNGREVRDLEEGKTIDADHSDV